MANNRNTYQQVQTVSVKRESLLDIATNLDLSKKELRVILVLLTQLDGYSQPKKLNENHHDPLNFKIIDVSAIADVLTMTKKEVKKAIEKIHDEGIIEEGSNDTVSHGYRFTF